MPIADRSDGLTLGNAGSIRGRMGASLALMEIDVILAGLGEERFSR